MPCKFVTGKLWDLRISFCVLDKYLQMVQKPLKCCRGSMCEARFRDRPSCSVLEQELRQGLFAAKKGGSRLVFAGCEYCRGDGT